MFSGMRPSNSIDHDDGKLGPDEDPEELSSAPESGQPPGGPEDPWEGEEKTTPGLGPTTPRQRTSSSAARRRVRVTHARAQDSSIRDDAETTPRPTPRPRRDYATKARRAGDLGQRRDAAHPAEVAAVERGGRVGERQAVVERPALQLAVDERARGRPRWRRSCRRPRPGARAVGRGCRFRARSPPPRPG